MKTALATTCSAEKSLAPGPLPATERYGHPRIAAAAGSARRRGLPFFVVSGRFGLLGPDDRIPWYDHALEGTEVDELARSVALSLEAAGVQRLEAWLEPRDTPGWGPYHDLLELAAHAAGVELVVVSPPA